MTTFYVTVAVIIIAFLGIILGSFCCVYQRDSKALAAYSSVTHIRFLLLSFSWWQYNI